MVIMNIIKECFFEKDWKLEDIRREASASASSSASVSAPTAATTGGGTAARLLSLTGRGLGGDTTSFRPPVDSIPRQIV